MTPKFQVEQKVWVQPMAEWARIESVHDGQYILENWGAVWPESCLRSECERKAAVLKMAVERTQREEWDRQRYQELLDSEPQEENYPTLLDYHTAYCIWAESFWECGNMPGNVREIYNRYMLRYRFVLGS